MSLSCSSVQWRGVTFTSDHSGDFGLGVVRGWDELPAVRRDATPRPWQHGRFDAVSLSDERIVVMGGQILSTERDALLAALGEVMTYDDAGSPEPLVITRAGRTLTAYARLTAFTTPTDFDWAVGLVPYSIEWRCSDPLRYGPAQVESTGFAVDQSGLEFDLFTDGTTDTGYLEFGDPGALTGTVTLLNSGSAPAPWVATVAGPVLDAGFELAQAGRVVRYSRGVPSGSVLTLDSATGRATLDGSDSSRWLTLKEFTPVPAGGSLDILFRPVEGASSALLTVTTHPASW